MKISGGYRWYKKTDRGKKIIPQGIIHVFGRKSIKLGLAKNLTDRNNILEPIFEIKMFHMKRKPSKIKSHNYYEDSEPQ